ncbi:MAG: DUF983 domain-containing protein [Gemmatimonadales bacterium]|nr:DUF983 domain-containing protein [Gemmatimonadales bacterium]MDZ4389020.1 DUF983 domain-containing protein [Gemmatimonadales bacterium]
MTPAWQIWWRALRLRCVACGGSPVMLAWFRESANCPRCGIKLDRAEDGHQVGSYTLNISLTLLLLVAGMCTAIWLSWPTPPWTAITIGSVAAAIVLPLLLYPWTKTFYLALHILLHPPEERDFEAPREPGLNRRS